MPKSNARITFGGLLLFSFSRQTSRRSPDKRSRCEIGILTQTGGDEHEFVIKVEVEPGIGDSLTLAEPEKLGMSANPLVVAHSEIRKYASLNLYLGVPKPLPPQSGLVIRDKSFNNVLDLEGEDFYREKVSVLPGRYTVLSATTGVFSGVNATADAEFARVSKRVLDGILRDFRRPDNWDRLLDPDKRLVASYSRQVKSEIEISKGASLVLQGVKKNGKVETIFNLPHPSVLKTKRYVIEITNLDKKNDPADEHHRIDNCAAFLHHSLALDTSRTWTKMKYGLIENFDYGIAGGQEQRCDEACCLVATVGTSNSISATAQQAARTAGKQKRAKKK